MQSLFFIVSILPAALADAPVVPAATVELVTAAGDGFQYGCPVGWEIKPPQGAQKSLNCHSPEGVMTMCIAMPEPTVRNATPTSHWKLIMEANERLLGPIELKEEGPSSANGVDFYRAVSTESNSLTVYYTFAQGGKAVSMSCMAFGGGDITVFDAIGQSFRWK
ncbi:MAG: hypothetical protein HN348_25520 [Proteobacteria bacterium]|jgi:hypothetical protein|nr:hypothetical protein [Pseudomonadota bacterium]